MTHFIDIDFVFQTEETPQPSSNNTILIILIAMIVITWGVAATAYFGVVDYKGMLSELRSGQSREKKQVSDLQHCVRCIHYADVSCLVNNTPTVKSRRLSSDQSCQTVHYSAKLEDYRMDVFAYNPC